jgi:hypothetical protein
MLRSGAKSNGKNPPAEKLDMDFAARSGRHGSMDDDNAELINLLSTRIGTIMEDTSVIALTLGSQGSGERLARIQQLTRASASIAALAAAVEALI